MIHPTASILITILLLSSALTIALISPVLASNSPSISVAVQNPSQVVVGQAFDVRVMVTITGAKGDGTEYLTVGILDRNNNGVTGTFSCLPNQCQTLPWASSNEAVCSEPLGTMTSGVVTVDFNLISPNEVGLWDLHANGDVIGGGSGSSAELSFGTQSFTIELVSSITNTIVQTSSLQMPQPPQQTAQSTNNTPQLVLALAVIAAVVLGALFLYSRRKGQTAVTQVEKVEPKAEEVGIDATRPSAKTVEGKMTKAGMVRSKTEESGKNFCIECGSELPSKAKFCNNCGTKQP